MRPIKKLAIAAVVLAAALVTISSDSFAIIGRPLTPMSYAGVARRTVRRSAYYGAPYYYGVPPR